MAVNGPQDAADVGGFGRNGERFAIPFAADAGTKGFYGCLAAFGFTCLRADPETMASLLDAVKTPGIRLSK
jgi:hypothetical protein